MTDGMKRSLTYHGGQLAGQIVSFATVAVILFTAAAWLFGDKAREQIRESAGTDEIARAVSSIDSNISQITTSVEAQETQISLIKDQVGQATRGLARVETKQTSIEVSLEDFNTRLGPPPVVEWDADGSFIDQRCQVGGECSAVFRVRRTDFGENCTLEGSTLILRDYRNNRLIVRDSGTERAQLSDEWTLVPIDFTVPREAAIGLAAFRVDNLTYSTCTGWQGIIEASSPSLNFYVTGEG